MERQYCPDCKRSLLKVNESRPCPKCGGLSRVYRPEHAEKYLIGQVGKFRITGSRPRPQGWKTQYTRLKMAFYTLDECWMVGARELGRSEIEQRVYNFFAQCHNMKDWLKSDPEREPQEARKAVERYVGRSRPLQSAIAVSNTHKHRQRHEGQVAGDITRITVRPEGASVVIGLTDFDRYNQSWACDDLAECCMEDWRRFVLDHNAEPAPRGDNDED